MKAEKTDEQKQAEKDAQRQKVLQDQQATAAKLELNRRNGQAAARGAGVQSFVRTGATGSPNSMLASVLGA